MGCHFLLQGIFPTQGSNPHRIVCIAGTFFTAEPPGKPQKMCSFLFLHLVSRNGIFSTLSFYTLPAFKPMMTITSSKKLYPSALGDRLFRKISLPFKTHRRSHCTSLLHSPPDFDRVLEIQKRRKAHLINKSRSRDTHKPPSG